MDVKAAGMWGRRSNCWLGKILLFFSGNMGKNISPLAEATPKSPFPRAPKGAKNNQQHANKEKRIWLDEWGRWTARDFLRNRPLCKNTKLKIFDLFYFSTTFFHLNKISPRPLVWHSLQQGIKKKKQWIGTHEAQRKKKNKKTFSGAKISRNSLI